LTTDFDTRVAANEPINGVSFDVRLNAEQMKQRHSIRQSSVYNSRAACQKRYSRISSSELRVTLMVCIISFQKLLISCKACVPVFSYYFNLKGHINVHFKRNGALACPHKHRLPIRLFQLDNVRSLLGERLFLTV
jgi:hypothetical protein